MKFSKTTGCFYPDNINYPNLPTDLIAVAQTDFATAMARPAGATLDVQNGVFVLVPAPTLSSAQLLAQAQQAQIALIKHGYWTDAARTLIVAGTPWNCDVDSLKTLFSSLQAAQTLQATSVVWADDNWVNHTLLLADALALLTTLYSWTNPLFELQGALITEINAAATPAAVQAIVWTTPAAPSGTTLGA